MPIPSGDALAPSTAPCAAQSSDSPVHATDVDPDFFGPPPSGGRTSANDLAAAGARRALVLAALPHIRAGRTLDDTAARVDSSRAALSRALSLHGRLSKRASLITRAEHIIALPLEALAAPRKSRARDPWQQLLDEDEEARRQLHWFYGRTMKASSDYMTHGRRTGSMASALKLWGRWLDLRLPADHTIRPLLPALASGSQPASLLRWLRKITPGLEAKIRGAEHTQLHTFSGRRSLQIELEDGSRVDLLPGQGWVFDDQSINWPFWFELPDHLRRDLPDLAAHPMIGRHGVGVGRQTLCCMDVASAAWLGTEHLGRVRDSYTADILLRFIRNLMTDYGKPDYIFFEQNVWAARKLKGWCIDTLDYAEPGLVRPELAQAERARLQDGLRALGIHIVYCHGPHGPGKALLESSFKYLQTILGGFFERGEGVHVGSHAGEFEKAARRMRQAQNGVKHARDLGFVHIERSVDVHWDGMRWCNEQAKSERGGARPVDLLAGAPARRPLTRDDLAVFLPELRERLMIRGGHVWPQHAGREFSFIAPDLFCELGDGFKVSVRFDPADPALGAAIYRADTGAMLGWADLHTDAPLISLRDRSNDPGLQLVKQYRAAHQTRYRAYDLASLTTVKRAAVRDGRGNTASIEKPCSADLQVGTGTPASISAPERRQAAGATRASTLPLPKGEGRGEGQAASRIRPSAAELVLARHAERAAEPVVSPDW